MLVQETEIESAPGTVLVAESRNPVDAALAAYRDAARGVSPRPEADISLGDGLEVETAEIDALLSTARVRASGGRLRRVFIRPLWERLPEETVRRGQVRAVLRLLAEPSNTACEEKDLTTALNRLLYAGGHQAYSEVLGCFEQEPRLRSVPALVEALRASDACSVASALESLWGVLFIAVFLGAGCLATARSPLEFAGGLITPTVMAVATLASVWTRSKRRSKPCLPLLRMLEDVEITDPRTRRWALHPIKLLANTASVQPRNVRKQAQRLSRRRWEQSGEFLPISATSPTPTAESLPVPSHSAVSEDKTP